MTRTITLAMIKMISDGDNRSNLTKSHVVRVLGRTGRCLPVEKRADGRMDVPRNKERTLQQSNGMILTAQATHYG